MTDAELTPKEVGGFRILRRLASGATSDVLLARAEGPHGFQRVVALKILLARTKSNPDFERHFAAEASAYARLAHPAVVKLYDFFSADGQLVMVLEFVDGLPLHKLRAMLAISGERIDDAAALFLGLRVFSALAAAHGARDPATGEFAPIAHYDLNPSNILVPWDGQVKVGDFGIARAAGVQADARSGFIKGTYGYTAPEQVDGAAATVRADVYSAGLILWELLARRKAVQRGTLNDAQVLKAMAQPEFPALELLRPDLDAPVRTAVRRALEPNPELRTITAEEMVHILRQTAPLEEGRRSLSAALARVRGAGAGDPLAATSQGPSAAEPESFAVTTPHGEERLDPEQTAPFAAVTEETGDLGKIAFYGRIKLPTESQPPREPAPATKPGTGPASPRPFASPVLPSAPPAAVSVAPPPLPGASTPLAPKVSASAPPTAPVASSPPPPTPTTPPESSGPSSVPTGAAGLSKTGESPAAGRAIPRPTLDRRGSNSPTVPAPPLESEVPRNQAPIPAAGRPPSATTSATPRVPMGSTVGTIVGLPAFSPPPLVPEVPPRIPPPVEPVEAVAPLEAETAPIVVAATTEASAALAPPPLTARSSDIAALAPPVVDFGADAAVEPPPTASDPAEERTAPVAEGAPIEAVPSRGSVRPNAPPYVLSSLPPPAPRRSFPWGAIALLGVLLAAGGGYVLLHDPDAPAIPAASNPPSSPVAAAKTPVPAASTTPATTPAAGASTTRESSSPTIAATTASAAPSAAPSAAAAPSAVSGAAATPSATANAPAVASTAFKTPAAPSPGSPTSPTSSGSSGADSADSGLINPPASAAGHRVFVDGKVAGEGTAPIRVHCGSHLVQVGSAGVEKKVDVPCGGALTL